MRCYSCRRGGGLIGLEMEQLGFDLWLASCLIVLRQDTLYYSYNASLHLGGVYMGTSKLLWQPDKMLTSISRSREAFIAIVTFYSRQLFHDFNKSESSTINKEIYFVLCCQDSKGLTLWIDTQVSSKESSKAPAAAVSENWRPQYLSPIKL